jgi:hypothetical protein
MDILDKVMKGKLARSEILFDFYYDITKACLIKTDDIERFFNNMNLLKIPDNSEINHYYNQIFITNFLAKVDTTLILLFYNTPEGETNKLKKSISSKGSNSLANKVKKKIAYYANYKIEGLNLISNKKSRIVDQILHDLK